MNNTTKVKQEPLDGFPRKRSSNPPHGLPPAAITTGVVLRADVARAVQPPSWEQVERYLRIGADREWIESFADAVPTFGVDLELRRRTERPPWRLVERYLSSGEHAPWVEWYRDASPAFAALVEARRSSWQPPWEVVDECLRTGEYLEWVEDHARCSPSFARVLTSMQDWDDASSPPSSGARIIPLSPRSSRRGAT